MAQPLTPLEATTETSLADGAALLLSASGRNVDILDAFRHLSSRGYAKICVLCARLDSPLAKTALVNGHNAYEFKIPSGKDGYLATNSLVSTMILLYRAFATAAGEVPADVTEVMARHTDPESWIPSWGRAKEAAESNTLVVLADGWGQVAAADIESRFVEAALGNVSISDYRNFAHGRHLWIDKHRDTSAVVSLETPSSKLLADHTLRLLPPDTAIMRIQSVSDAGHWLRSNS